MNEVLRPLASQIELVPKSRLELSPVYRLENLGDVLAFARRIARFVIELESSEKSYGIRCVYQGFTFSILYFPEHQGFRSNVVEMMGGGREEVGITDQSKAHFVEQIVVSTYHTYREGLVHGMKSSLQNGSESNTWAEIVAQILRKFTGERRD